MYAWRTTNQHLHHILTLQPILMKILEVEIEIFFKIDWLSIIKKISISNPNDLMRMVFTK